MIVFVSDLYVEDYVGGGELTTEAIIEGCSLPVLKLRSSEVTPQHLVQFSDRHWIFGNFSSLNPSLLLPLMKNISYSVVEYDYKFCKYRLPEKHIAAEGECDCAYNIGGKLISSFFAKAKSLWFMSESQKNIYTNHYKFLDKKTTRVLSSMFSSSALDFMSNYRNDNRGDTWLIQKSDSWVKGTEDAIKYAENNDLKYELFSNLTHSDLLQKFKNSKGFIFLPKGPDTCPRTTIEAKILGCELILNENVQHKDEKWFNSEPEQIINYLRSRSDTFWEEIYNFTRAPSKLISKEETHFKVIIPTYNSEDWISKCISSVLDQKYSNFQCIVCDDISSDSTWDKINSFEHPSLIKVKNTEKKFALKNIFDSITTLRPKANDVMVVLDGDDWLSNKNVLSKLNEYYKNKNCNMTFGSFVRYPDGSIGQESSEYPKEVIDKNAFRQDSWRASHLKTFRYLLWNNIDPDDLKDEQGKFYEVSYDQAMMLPMLEMAGNTSKYVPEVLCVYNVGNPNAVNQTRQKLQYETMLKIRNKKRYNKI